MDKKELDEILRLHKAWLNDEPGGKRADLTCADLQGANLQGADLRRADLQGAHLQRADLQGADLRRANLQGANLQGADLRRADLQGAHLQRADLQGADLRGAELRGAELQGAYLQDANLQGAYLQDANLQDAGCGFDAFFGSVQGAPFFQAVRGFGSRNAALTLLAIGGRKEWRWFTGCFTGSEDELRAAVAEKHGESKAGRCYLRAIDYLAAQAEDNRKED